MIKILYFTILWSISIISLSAQPSYDVTVFGTDLIAASEIETNHSEQLDELVRLYESDRPGYRIKRKELQNELEEANSFAYTNLYLFKSYSGSFSFIIDFVELQEAEERLNFRKLDTKSFSDPDGLIAKWTEYEEESAELFESGEIRDMKCPVIHCTWSFNHPRLAPFLDYFNEFAPKNRELLIDILNSSNSTNDRASASFLLAHAGMDEDDLLQTLMPAIHDPESSVRNNSMRVIYYIARSNPDSKMDVGKIIRALDYPSFTDRNKALVILRSLPLPNLSSEEKRRLFPILLEILEKKDAHNHRNAHTVLKNLSGENFGLNEIALWKQWMEKAMD